MLLNGIPEQTNNTPQPTNGNAFNNYVIPSLNVGLQAFQTWLTYKYGSATTQQVINNPTSDTANQLWMQYQMSLLQNQNSKSDNDKTILYVALAALGLMAMFMMSNDNKRR